MRYASKAEKKCSLRPRENLVNVCAIVLTCLLGLSAQTRMMFTWCSSSVLRTVASVASRVSESVLCRRPVASSSTSMSSRYWCIFQLSWRASSKETLESQSDRLTSRRATTGPNSRNHRADLVSVSCRWQATTCKTKRQQEPKTATLLATGLRYTLAEAACTAVTTSSPLLTKQTAEEEYGASTWTAASETERKQRAATDPQARSDWDGKGLNIARVNSKPYREAARTSSRGPAAAPSHQWIHYVSECCCHVDAEFE